MSEDVKICRLCQQPLSGKKNTSDFCGDAHRMRWHRAVTAVGRKMLETGIISDEDVRRADRAVNGNVEDDQGGSK